MIFGNHGGFFYWIEYQRLRVFPGGDLERCLKTYQVPTDATDARLHAYAWHRIDADMNQLHEIADQPFLECAGISG